MDIGGIALGLYVGFWLCFVGGIVDVIAYVKSPELSALGIAVGIAKFMFSSALGWGSATILILPGAALLKD